jgi:hypothetical protein
MELTPIRGTAAASALLLLVLDRRAAAQSADLHRDGHDADITGDIATLRDQAMREGSARQGADLHRPARLLAALPSETMSFHLVQD